MGRCKGADEFVNCVVRRGDRDMLLKPSLIIAALIVPLVAGYIIALSIITGYDMYDDDTEALVMLASALMAFIVELCIVSFMIYCVSRRNRNHLKRDIVWMTSLCDFVDFHRGDSEDMRRILKKTSRATNKATAWLSMLIWIVYLALMVVAGILLLSTDVSALEDALTAEATIIAITFTLLLLLLIEFVVTIGTVVGFPAKHDSNQAKFTKELGQQCAKFGLDVDPMGHDVKRRHQWIHLVLIVITLGLYGIVYLVVVCRDMNKHLRNQWEYETDLMERIVEFEGGVGIEATSEGEKSRAAKIISGLM